MIEVMPKVILMRSIRGTPTVVDIMTLAGQQAATRDAQVATGIMLRHDPAVRLRVNGHFMCMHQTVSWG